MFVRRGHADDLGGVRPGVGHEFDHQRIFRVRRERGAVLAGSMTRQCYAQFCDLLGCGAKRSPSPDCPRNPPGQLGLTPARDGACSPTATSQVRWFALTATCAGVIVTPAGYIPVDRARTASRERGTTTRMGQMK
jgi:hypothetical protein